MEKSIQSDRKKRCCKRKIDKDTQARVPETQYVKKAVQEDDEICRQLYF